MSFTFDALGDGNCFYNSITVRLAVDWLNDTLPKNATTKNQLIALFREVDKFAPELNIGQQLTGRISRKTIDDVFRIILDSCQIDEETTNWVKYQKLMGPVAREFITGQIENNLAIKQKVLQKLTQHLTGTLDISTVDDIIYPAYFQGMPVIQQKLKDTVMDVGTDIAVRKVALADWFYNEEDAIGFEQWLRGENGVALDTTLAGVVELEVFSELFKTSMQYKMPDDRQGVNQLITGFGEATPIRVGTLEAKAYNAQSTYSLEYTGGHWKVYLPNDEPGLNRQICADYIPQRDAYIEHVSILEKHNEAKLHLRQYKSYKAHAESLGLEKEDYCAIYRLSSTEFDKNSAPARLVKPWLSDLTQSLKTSGASHQLDPQPISRTALEQPAVMPKEKQATPKTNKPVLSSANPYRNSISIAAILLMAISAVVIYSNPIGLPTALFTLALCASTATLGLNIKNSLKGHFNRPATSSVSDLDDDSSSAALDPMVTAALTTPPETLIQSKSPTETDIPTTSDTQQKPEENLTPRHRQG
tara:strand:+ start:28463 stop:30055 length:1593 start_codon:yes stop_codon:yes gene_type:complete